MLATWERVSFKLVRKVYGIETIHDFREVVARNTWLSKALAPLQRAKISDVVRKSPVLFVHIPKNGGTSVAKSLYGEHVWHKSVRFYEASEPQMLTDMETVAIIREPTERFLSTYDFFREGGGEVANVLPSGAKALATMTSPDALLDYVESGVDDWLQVDAPARPQWWFIVDKENRIKVKELFMLNGGMAALAEIINRCGISQLRHINRTRRSRVELSEGQLARLKRLYATDYALYDIVSRANDNPAIAYGAKVSSKGISLATKVWSTLAVFIGLNSWLTDVATDMAA